MDFPRSAVLLVATVVLTVVADGCGSEDERDKSPEAASPSVTATAPAPTLPPSGDTPPAGEDDGPDDTREIAIDEVMNLDDDDRRVRELPEDWQSDDATVNSAAGEAAGVVGYLADPYGIGYLDRESGNVRRLSASPADGGGDTIMDWHGEWVVFLRTFVNRMPLPEWELHAANIETGESRMLSEADPDVMDTPGLQPKFPYGFAADPVVEAGRVVWAEIVVDDETGDPRKDILMYDIESDEEQVIYTVDDPTSEDAWGPSISGDRVAWVGWDAPEEPCYIMVYDIQSKELRRFDVGGAIRSATLADGGDTVAWNEDDIIHVMDLATEERWHLESPSIGYLHARGPLVSWSENMGADGPLGWIDVRDKTATLIEAGSGTRLSQRGLITAERLLVMAPA